MRTSPLIWIGRVYSSYTKIDVLPHQENKSQGSRSIFDELAFRLESIPHAQEQKLRSKYKSVSTKQSINLREATSHLPFLMRSKSSCHFQHSPGQFPTELCHHITSVSYGRDSREMKFTHERMINIIITWMRVHLKRVRNWYHPPITDDKV